MRAVHIVGDGGPDRLELVQVDPPERGEGEVSIAVAAAGVSYPELLQSKGLYQYQPPLPFVPGGEVAGTVLEAPSTSSLTVGQRVVALASSGGYAEVAVAKQHVVFPIPDDLEFEVAAAIPANYLTCQFALVHRAALGPGETVLVHGAAGGIGVAAVQVAKAQGAERVIAVVSSEAKGEVALAAGADEWVGVDDFLDRARSGGGVDMVVDPVGGDRFTDSLRALRAGGRVVVLGFVAGEIPVVKVNRLLLSNISVVGAGLGAYLAGRPGHETQLWSEILPHIESGAMRPPVIDTYRLGDAGRALTALEERRLLGKAVLCTDRHP